MARPQTITDDDILRAAREAFLELGPRVSVAEVARRLGVSHSALFQRVGTKRDLLLRALRPEGPPKVLLARLEQGPVPGDPVDEQLLPVLSDLYALIDDVLPALLVLRSARLPEPPPGAGRPVPIQLRQALTRWLSRASAAGCTEIPSPWAVAEGLLGALEARALNRHLGGPDHVLGDDASFLRDLLQGLVLSSRATGPSSERSIKGGPR